MSKQFPDQCAAPGKAETSGAGAAALREWQHLQPLIKPVKVASGAAAAAAAGGGQPAEAVPKAASPADSKPDSELKAAAQSAAGGSSSAEVKERVCANGDNCFCKRKNKTPEFSGSQAQCKQCLAEAQRLGYKAKKASGTVSAFAGLSE